MSKSRAKVLSLTEFSMLLAIEAIFCFTILGSVPIGPTIVATLAMIPVIITAILLGPAAGTLMGVMTGIFSLIVWTFAPANPVTAFLFTPFYSFGGIHGNIWSLVLCMVPRALVGTVAGFSFRFFEWAYRKIFKLDKGGRKSGAAAMLTPVPFILSGILGSATNTILFLCGVYIFFGPQFAVAIKITTMAVSTVLLGLALTNGVAEAILAAVVTPAVCIPIKKFLHR